MYQTLLITIENNICIITINRPDKLNALNKVVIDELNAAIDEVYNNNEIKSAIITALAKKGQDVFLKLKIHQSQSLRV
jgi:enoyl-CoA hydratase